MLCKAEDGNEFGNLKNVAEAGKAEHGDKTVEIHVL